MSTTRKQRERRRNQQLQKRVSRRMFLEGLEDRQLLAADVGAQSLLAPQVQEDESELPTDVPRAEIVRTAVHGSLADQADVDAFRVHLQQGEIFTVELNDASGSVDVKLTDAAGALVDAAFMDRETGAAAEDAFIFHADHDGEFLVAVDSDAAQTSALDYRLSMRTIALHEDYINPQLLNPQVEELLAHDELRMYTWQDGDKLAVAGPTGHGFEMTGDWQATTNTRVGHLLKQLSVRTDAAEAVLTDIVNLVDQGAQTVDEFVEQLGDHEIVDFLHNGIEDLRGLIESIVHGEEHTAYTTYTTSGGDMAAGALLQLLGPTAESDFAATIIQGLMNDVTVEVNVTSTEWDHSFGEIDSINVVLDRGDVEFSTGEGLDLNAAVNDILDTIPGLGEAVDLQAPILSWGVKLGGEREMVELANRFDAPLNTAVPYIHFAAHWAIGASVGEVSVEAASAGAAVFVDPSDPFVYIGFVSPIVSGAKAISSHGYMPLRLTADQTPDGWDQSFFGHMHVNAGGSLTKVIDGEGQVYLDFDTEDVGSITLSPNVVSAFVTGSPVATILAGAEAAMNLDQLPDPVELLAHSAIAVKGTFEVDDPLGTKKDKDNNDQGDSQQNGGADSSSQDGGSSQSTSPQSDESDSSSSDTEESSSPESQDNTQQQPQDQQQSEDEESEEELLEANENGVQLVGTFIQHPSGTYYHAMGELSVSNLMGIPFVSGSAQVVQDVQVLEDGSFRLRYTGEMELLGYQLSEAELIIDNQGATIEGMIQVPGPNGNIVEAQVSGEISAEALFLQGSGYIDLEAARTQAEFRLDHTGLTASMDVDLAGSTVHVSGAINSDGTYRLEGVADINLLGMDMAGGLVRIDSETGVTIIAENTAGDSLKNQAAPALRQWAEDAQHVMEAAEADLERARGDVQQLEGELQAARDSAAAAVNAFSAQLDDAQRAVDSAAAHKSSMYSWMRREYSAYRSAVRARQSANIWNYASRRANELYRYSRYQTARTAYYAANSALSVASSALTAIRNSAGWKAVGVDANPEVLRLTAELAVSRVALDAAEASLYILRTTGLGETFENVSGAALNAAAWLAENNGSDLLNLNRLEFRGAIGDLLNADAGLAISLDVDVDYTFQGERDSWGAALHTNDLLGDLADALVDELTN